VRNVNKIRLGLLTSHPGDKILDIGCSFGAQAMLIARQGLEVHAIDHSEALLQRFRLELQKDQLNCHPTLADAHQLPYPDGCFDAVVSTEVFEHVPNPDQVAIEAYRALKPGGRACIAVPTELSERLFRRLHPHWVEDSEHIHIFRLPSLLAMLRQAGFRIIRIDRQNFEWTAFWVVHSLFRSRFDFTGTPTEHQLLSRVMIRGWQILDRLGIGAPIKWLGNRVSPKSVYVYAEKPAGG
jgi:2-polyprenyl-3-methyl-5-hydroxy-6-metoxy-1,4-benzoquinol methylase